MAITPDELLRDWGFLANPFREAVAEQEHGIESAFVRPSYFGEFLGEPSRPRSAFIFGDRGDGKSRINRSTQSLLSLADPKPLLVDYSDFTWVEQEPLRDMALERHLERVLIGAVDQLVREAMKNPTLVSNLSDEMRMRFRWCSLRFKAAGLARERQRNARTLLEHGRTGRLEGLRSASRWLGDHLAQKRVDLERQVEDASKIAELIRMTLVFLGPSLPTRELAGPASINHVREMVDLVRACGFTGILIFVDRIDEAPATADRPDKAAELVRSLTTSLPLLEFDGLGVKFFLPKVVFTQLRRELRTDRIFTREIEWTRESLTELLELRLRSFSREARTSLHPFLAADVRPTFDEIIHYYSASNPRNLLRLLDHVMTETARETDGEKPPHERSVSSGSLKAGVRGFYYLRSGEADGAEYIERIENMWEGEPPLQL